MEKISRIKVAADIDEFSKIMLFVSAAARDSGFSDERVSEVQLASEEIFVNICKYAYENRKLDVEINCESGPGSLNIEFIDQGRHFDPTALIDPDINLDVSERKIGGLGVFLAKKMSDGFRYSREKGRNVLNVAFSQRKCR